MPDYRKYRAPTEDHTALVDPPWSDQLRQLAAPAPSPAIELAGAPLTAVIAEARRDLIEAAIEHTSGYSNVDQAAVRASAGDRPIVVSGHQPELFHPGVWFKNFALDALAKSAGGIGVHLLIDSDLCRAAQVRAPTGSIAAPQWSTVAFDASGPPTPYEERRVRDPNRFDSFDQRVTDTIAGLVDRPLVASVWPDARDAARRTDRLGLAVSVARHRLEQRWGARTLEAPIGRVCEGVGFRRLAAHLLLTAPEARRAYNSALDGYRTAHRLRSAAQPLPDLAADASGVETPLWVWSETDPVRRPLFVERVGDRLRLTNRAGWDAAAPTEPDQLIDRLGDLRATGLKVRSRALITTLFARFALGDLFLHGIGGAKYDQVTDHFAAGWLGTPPPPHATLTATLRLPIAHDSPTEADRLRLVKRARDLRFHPERFLANDSVASEAIAAKRRWVATPKTPTNAGERHRAIAAANTQLRERLAADASANEADLHALEQRRSGAAILASREQSFVLFPADDARRRLSALCRIDSGG